MLWVKTAKLAAGRVRKWYAGPLGHFFQRRGGGDEPQEIFPKLVPYPVIRGIIL